MPPTHLIAFRDGSYKKVQPTSWKQSQWIHFTLEDGSCVMVNPARVNYIHKDIQGETPPGSPEPRKPVCPVPLKQKKPWYSRLLDLVHPAWGPF